jgi:hypothetical protein
MTRRISEKKITFLVAERDIDSPFRASGAIIFEQMTNQTPISVLEHGRKLGDRYGRIWIGQIDESDLVPLDEFKLPDDDIVQNPGIE